MMIKLKLKLQHKVDKLGDVYKKKLLVIHPDMIRTDISQSPPEKQLEGPWGVAHCRLHSFDFYIWSFILTEFWGGFFSTRHRRFPCRVCKLLGLEMLLGCIVWLVDAPFIKDMHIKHVPRSYFQDGDTKML